MDEKLKALKVTIRCVPLDADGRAGQVHLHRASPAPNAACLRRRIEPCAVGVVGHDESTSISVHSSWATSTSLTPVLLLVAASSRHEAALDWARERIEQHFGPLALVSDAFDFTETDYYAATMGADLKKQFLAVRAADRSGRAGRHQAARPTPGKPSTRRWAGTPSRGR